MKTKITTLIVSLGIGQLRAESTGEKPTSDVPQNQIPVQQERKSITLKEMLDRIEWAEGEVRKQDDAKRKAGVESQEEGGKTFLEYFVPNSGLSSSENVDAPTSSENVDAPTSSKNSDRVKNLRGIGSSPGIGSSSSSGGNADSMLQKMSENEQAISSMNGKEDQSKWCMNKHTGGGLAGDTDTKDGPTDEEVKKSLTTLTDAKGLAKFQMISICQINNVLPPDQIPKITLAQWKKLGIYQLWTLFGRWYTFPDSEFDKPMNITDAVQKQTTARKNFHALHGVEDEDAYTEKLKADQKVRQIVSNVQVEGTKGGVMPFVDFKLQPLENGKLENNVNQTQTERQQDGVNSGGLSCKGRTGQNGNDTMVHGNLAEIQNQYIFHALLSHAFDPLNDLYCSGYRDSDFLHFDVPRDLRSNMDSGLQQIWAKMHGRDKHQRPKHTLWDDDLKSEKSIRAVSPEKFRLITIEQILGDESGATNPSGKKINTITNEAIKGITFEQWNSLDIPHLWVFAKRIVKDKDLRGYKFPQYTSPASSESQTLKIPAMKFKNTNGANGNQAFLEKENAQSTSNILNPVNFFLEKQRKTDRKADGKTDGDTFDYKAFLKGAHIDTEFVQRYIAGKSLLEFIFVTFKQDGYAERILDDDLLNDSTSDENKLNLIATIPANHFGNIKTCQIQKVLTEGAVKAATYDQWQSLNMNQLWFVVKRWHTVLMKQKIPERHLTKKVTTTRTTQQKDGEEDVFVNTKIEWQENDSVHGFETLPSRFFGKTMFDAILNIELDEAYQEAFIDEVVWDDRIRHLLHTQEQIYYRYSGLEGYTINGDPENTLGALFGSERWISLQLKVFSSLAYFRGLIKHKILPQYARFVLRGLAEIGQAGVDRQVIVANRLRNGNTGGVAKSSFLQKNSEPKFLRAAQDVRDVQHEIGMLLGTLNTMGPSISRNRDTNSPEKSPVSPTTKLPTNSIKYECLRLSGSICEEGSAEFNAYQNIFRGLLQDDFALANHYALLFLNSRVASRNENGEVYWPTMEYYTDDNLLKMPYLNDLLRKEFADYKYEHTYGFSDWVIDDTLRNNAISYYRVRGPWRLFKEFLGFWPNLWPIPWPAEGSGHALPTKWWCCYTSFKNILVTPEENMLLESGSSLMLPEQELAEYLRGGCQCCHRGCARQENAENTGQKPAGESNTVGKYVPKPPNGPEPENSFWWYLFKNFVNPYFYNQELFRFVLEAFVFGYSAFYVRPFWNFHNDQFLSDYGWVTTFINDNFLCHCNIAKHCIDQTIAALFSTWPNFLAYWFSFYWWVDPYGVYQSKGPNSDEMWKSSRRIGDWSWNDSDGLKKIPSAGGPLTAPGAMENGSIMQQSTVVWKQPSWKTLGGVLPIIRDGPVTDNDSSDEKKTKYNKMQEFGPDQWQYWVAVFRILLSLLFHLLWIVCCCKGFKNLWWSLNLLETDCCCKLIGGCKLSIGTCGYVIFRLCCGLGLFCRSSGQTYTAQGQHVGCLASCIICQCCKTHVKIPEQQQKPPPQEFETLTTSVRLGSSPKQLAQEAARHQAHANKIHAAAAVMTAISGIEPPPEGGAYYYVTQQQPGLGLAFKLTNQITVQGVNVFRGVRNTVGSAAKNMAGPWHIGVPSSFGVPLHVAGRELGEQGNPSTNCRMNTNVDGVFGRSNNNSWIIH